MRVLVTGATGYIGGRLVPRLLEAGHTVRVLVREAESIQGRRWVEDVEASAEVGGGVVRGDLLRPETLDAAVDGVDAAYYLVHSMYGGADFELGDHVAARNFVDACSRVADGPRHVIYLGGLMPDPAGGPASPHLASRAEVGAVLATGLGVTEFRAGPIIGSGSASFEMVRYLTERLPVMVTPRWVNTRVCPIAVRDVLAYLEAALAADPAGVVDIGMAPISFKDMMLGVAARRGHRRLIIPTPVLAPRLAARWVGLVTPIPNALAVPLVEGALRPLIADTSRAAALFPSIEPLTYGEAVHLALEKIEKGDVETRWSGAMVLNPRVEESEACGMTAVIEDREGMARDQRNLTTPVPVEAMWRTLCGIGGRRGWYAWNWAWLLRGLADKLIGGPGIRRGRRDPNDLLEGEALDWWRVEEVDAPWDQADGRGLLRLRAEMKVPGRAWLQWEVWERGGWTRVIQTAMFEPRGLPGTLYWYAMLPAHGRLFPKMLRNLESDARRRWEAGEFGTPKGSGDDAPARQRQPGEPANQDLPGVQAGVQVAQEVGT